MKKTLLLVAAVVILAAPLMAFHDDGVAHCNGCHTMHNSQDGVAMNFNAAGTGPGTAPGTGYSDLLLFPNKSDVCLRCHEGSGTYHVWGPGGTSPGAYDEFGAGDFSFLLEDNINDAHSGAGNPVLGDAAGHTVISGIFNTTTDAYLSNAPGAVDAGYPSGDLACTSCHDPHGNQNFRLLYQDGQNSTSDTGYTVNWSSTIDAQPIPFFGMMGPEPPESNTNHNVYRSGYSEWCSECHGNFHQGPGTIHPSGDFLDTEQVLSYNFYDGTTDCVNNPPGVSGPTNPCGSGGFGTAYLAMVPLEGTNYTAGDTGSTEGATDGSSKVICASCHRAHATSAMDAGRWDFNVTGLAEDGDESTSYPMPNPYDAFQRSLCNKCHSKDEFDTLVDFTP